MEKLEIDKTDFHFAIATTTTNYNQLWDTDSEGKVKQRGFAPPLTLAIAYASGQSRVDVVRERASGRSQVSIRFLKWTLEI
jgi:hypothetical protein